jgi:valyl-tRNA synthetase
MYAIDTPPATVSGHLDLGHVYSYSHADLMARSWRMNGYNIFYEAQKGATLEATPTAGHPYLMPLMFDT